MQFCVTSIPVPLAGLFIFWGSKHIHLRNVLGDAPQCDFKEVLCFCFICSVECIPHGVRAALSYPLQQTLTPASFLRQTSWASTSTLFPNYSMNNVRRALKQEESAQTQGHYCGYWGLCCLSALMWCPLAWRSAAVTLFPATQTTRSSLFNPLSISLRPLLVTGLYLAYTSGYVHYRQLPYFPDSKSLWSTSRSSQKNV